MAEPAQAAQAAPGAPDAEALYALLREQLAAGLRPGERLVGIWRGGAWLAERLQADLGLAGPPGVLSSTLHRDDYGARGLSTSAASTQLAFEVEGADILLVDDVLYTGRTVRAALNELYDFGRPARVRLAVLADRGGRELPVAADFAAATVVLPAAQRLSLLRGADGRFGFTLRDRA